jgi:hypothetical protein
MDTETAWERAPDHAVRRSDQIGEVGFGHVVRWAHAEPDDQGVLWVDFAIYEQHGLHDVTYDSNGKTIGGTAHYEKPNATSSHDTTPDIDAALPFVHGFVKWDGCTQWWQNGGGHIDHRDDYDRLVDVLKLARKVAAELMPSTDVAQEYE